MTPLQQESEVVENINNQLASLNININDTVEEQLCFRKSGVE
ncbi:4466_t:CDS:1, partial [Paraglomus occultum]